MSIKSEVSCGNSLCCLMLLYRQMIILNNKIDLLVLARDATEG